MFMNEVKSKEVKLITELRNIGKIGVMLPHNREIKAAGHNHDMYVMVKRSSKSDSG